MALTPGIFEMSLVEKNKYGYWQRSENNEDLKDCCVLIATLNVLEGMKKMNDDKAQRIAQRFRAIRAGDQEGSFTYPSHIPKTIEWMTGEEFRGVLVCANAVETLRASSIRYGAEAGRYGFNSTKADSLLVPFIASIPHGEKKHHAVAVVGINSKPGSCNIIDNGVPTIIGKREIEGVYKILDCSTDINELARTTQRRFFVMEPVR